MIWTTTPWTLPANQAVSLHPEYEYSLLRVIGSAGDELLMLATELARCGAAARRARRVQAELGRIRGRRARGLPLRIRSTIAMVPVVLGEHVTLDSGTGAVHTAPGHGQEDFVVGRRYSLPVDNPVGSDGRFLPARRCSQASRCSRRTST